ncbi:hypothetical protein K458DRAFT_431455 [Lentithecium fluviatile CBS 122367]|uniref:Uncharacterized protein n=1 Tax=Lentithecium fluviatile CBS 122367 TaxID=1168545 RepID=A0A6G1J1Y7_9PLEO|nr:hypothetical protein K458DRAFT_431455 [Lentithecium fluviatile CBS 122367]
MARKPSLSPQFKNQILHAQAVPRFANAPSPLDSRAFPFRLQHISQSNQENMVALSLYSSVADHSAFLPYRPDTALFSSSVPPISSIPLNSAGFLRESTISETWIGPPLGRSNLEGPDFTFEVDIDFQSLMNPDLTQAVSGLVSTNNDASASIGYSGATKASPYNPDQSPTTTQAGTSTVSRNPRVHNPGNAASPAHILRANVHSVLETTWSVTLQPANTATTCQALTAPTFSAANTRGVRGVKTGFRGKTTL